MVQSLSICWVLRRINTGWCFGRWWSAMSAVSSIKKHLHRMSFGGWWVVIYAVSTTKMHDHRMCFVRWWAVMSTVSTTKMHGHRMCLRDDGLSCPQRPVLRSIITGCVFYHQVLSHTLLMTSMDYVCHVMWNDFYQSRE